MLDCPKFPEFLVSPERCEYAYWQVYPEYRLPAQGHRQHPSKHEADDRPADTCYKVDPDSASPLVRRKRICQNRRVIRPNQRRTYSLNETEEDKHRPGEGEAAKSRADCEYQKADVVETHFAVHVG